MRQNSTNQYNSTNLLVDIFLSRFKLYRYFLAYKLLQKYLPELQKNSHVITDELAKNIKKNPYPTLLVAAVAGAVLTRLMRGRRK